MHPIILLIVLIAVLVFVSWYKRAPKAQRKSIANKTLIFGGLGLILLLLLTGRLNPVFALVAAAIPIAYRLLSLVQVIQGLKSVKNAFKASSAGPTAGQSSDVETHFLKMTLNHDSGQMNGEVLDGPHKGKMLSDLELAELLILMDHFRSRDAQSAAVLETYLDRTFGDAWREQAGAGEGPQDDRRSADNMTVEEAREILGVDANATKEQIVEAHRRLMQKLHPDRGGSTYLAAQINAAKRLLLQG